MMFESQVGSYEPIHDEGFSAPNSILDPYTGLPYGKGYLGTDKKTSSELILEGFMSSDDALMVDESEWIDRIEEIEKNNRRGSDVIKAHAIRIKNQKQTNFCWGFAPTLGFEATRARQGHGYISLSPASLTCLITNYKNVGGWGTVFAKRIADTGLVPSEMWGDTEINRALDNHATRKVRELYRCPEWQKGRERDFKQLMSWLLLGFFVPVGLNHWKHEILACDPIYLNGKFGWRFANSWDYTYGDQGFGIMLGSKAIPDDHYRPIVVTAA